LLVGGLPPPGTPPNTNAGIVVVVVRLHDTPPNINANIVVVVVRLHDTPPNTNAGIVVVVVRLHDITVFAASHCIMATKLHVPSA